MKRNRFALLALTLSAALAGCSGLPQTGGGGGGTGNGSMLITMSANPLTPPASTSILSFAVTITGVALTPSSGNPVNISLPGTTFVVDLTRLQSDSAFLGGVLNNVPAGTYTNVTLAVSSASVTYCVQLNPGVPGCASGTVATVTSAAAAPVAAKSITVTANQTTALRLQADMTNALTINSSTQVVSAVNLGATNVFTLSTLPPTSSSLATNQLDFVEDFTGVVTAISGSSITITTSKHGAITTVANSSTFFSPTCALLGFSHDITCVKINQLASIDAALNSDGTFALLEYDTLAVTASDWIEGVVAADPFSSSQFEIVANDVFLAPSNSLIGTNLALSDPVTVNLANGAVFNVDSKGLLLPADATTFQNANDTSVLHPGQAVAVRVASFTAASGGTPAVVSADFVYLRFSRVSGSVFSNAPPNVFFIVRLAPFFGLTNQEQVQLNQAVAPETAPTNFEGVLDGTGLTVGQTASVRGLYFGPTSAIPFTVAKVRTH